MSLGEIIRIQAEVDLIYSSVDVEVAIQKMSKEITQVLEDKNLLILCIMTGGLITTGKLIPLLDFPLQIEYIHATRYQGKTNGGTMRWIKKPTTSLQDRRILIVDDILDIRKNINDCG